MLWFSGLPMLRALASANYAGVRALQQGFAQAQRRAQTRSVYVLTSCDGVSLTVERRVSNDACVMRVAQDFDHRQPREGAADGSAMWRSVRNPNPSY